mmetsp:Transcript_8842/g.11834  ORF Transcript_8842/g.11834 Transcript_8842/m.11834 type:complete len:85 (+) Transcript_8842:1258-1512(+)
MLKAVVMQWLLCPNSKNKPMMAFLLVVTFIHMHGELPQRRRRRFFCISVGLCAVFLLSCWEFCFNICIFYLYDLVDVNFWCSFG